MRATKYDVFLSYESRDLDEAEGIARFLRDHGMAVFLDRWYLIPGRPWPPELENAIYDCSSAAVLIGPHGMGPWQQRESQLALERQSKESSFTVIPILLPGAREPALGFLGINTWVDLRAGVSDNLQLEVLAAAIRGEAPAAVLDTTSRIKNNTCPYRGLQPFREEDWPFFYGRESFTDQLLEAVVQSNLVAVVGPSGSGKSSVARAGLIPRLRNQSTSPIWEIASLVPGKRPFESLAATMAPLLNSRSASPQPVDTKKLSRSLLRRDEELCDLVDAVLAQQLGTDRLLLLVDQWEEIFTLCEDKDERDEFLNQILKATLEGGLTVVLTLRSDFYSCLLSHRPLTDRLQSSIVNIGPMTRAELREAIEKPAAKVGLRFESKLVDRILGQAQEEPGNLALLEFVLSQLWETRQGPVLLHESYKLIGGIRGAIAKYAESTWENLTEQQRNKARQIFEQLIKVRYFGMETRRRATPAELPEDASGVLDLLVGSRLIVADRDTATGEKIFEVAHESLIQHWERLQRWINEDREFLLWLGRLRSSMAAWEKTHREKESLLRGAALVEAQAWLQKKPALLNIAQKNFIQSSETQRKFEQDRRDRETAALTRLSDVKRLQHFEEKAATLWPADPSLAEDFRRWLKDVKPLLERVGIHRDRLHDLRKKAIRSFKKTTAADAHGEQEGEIVFQFSNVDDQWQHDVLNDLVADLTRFIDEKEGTLASVRRRLNFALSVERLTIIEPLDKWNAVIGEIAESPLYSGLRIEPLLGLTPLGKDQDSGLYEFLHLETHNGPIPVRGNSTHASMSNDTGIIFVLIPGGKFWMGSQNKLREEPNFDRYAVDDEQPVHEVEIQSFLLSKYQMTQGQWLRCTGSNPSSYSAFSEFVDKKHHLSHPVEQVSWYDCMRVTERLGCTLPAEEQWEYAARAGTSSIWWTGHHKAGLRDAANLADRFAKENGGPPSWEFEEWNDGFVVHAPVGSFRPNAFGLHDMIGNVWEWCRSPKGSYRRPSSKGDEVKSAPADLKSRVIRGGSFSLAARIARCAVRYYYPPEASRGTVGLRPAREIP